MSLSSITQRRVEEGVIKEQVGILHQIYRLREGVNSWEETDSSK